MSEDVLRPIPAGGWAPYLDPGEKLLWTGEPAGGIKLKKTDWFMIPFSLFWCGFVVVWEAMAILGGAPLFFALFGLPFVAIGLYLLVGRFWVDAKKRAGTRYALTDRRAIVATEFMGRKLSSYRIGKETEITYEPGPQATLIFDRRQVGRGRNSQIRLTGFEYVEDGDTLYRITRAVQRGAPVATAEAGSDQ